MNDVLDNSNSKSIITSSALKPTDLEEKKQTRTDGTFEEDN
jgi:hypothetical protein